MGAFFNTEATEQPQRALCETSVTSVLKKSTKKKAALTGGLSILNT